MSTAIDTTKVTGRRELRFQTVDEIRADVDRLAQAKDITGLGNWTSGQVLQHLAVAMNMAVDGAPSMVPWIGRFIIRLFFKGKILKKRMSAGFKLPGRAGYLLPPPTTWEDGLRNFRAAFERLKSTTERKPHPAFGTLSLEEYERLTCRHSELHLSFLVPSQD
jgi:hypothetical protein